MGLKYYIIDDCPTRGENIPPPEEGLKILSLNFYFVHVRTGNSSCNIYVDLTQ